MAKYLDLCAEVDFDISAFIANAVKPAEEQKDEEENNDSVDSN